ncbi:MAG: hypothetical protein GX483_01005 [Actinomycetaceae bacterium]|nr:hypothetical protein [Actinomycetaceae bacterium]
MYDDGALVSAIRRQQEPRVMIDGALEIIARRQRYDPRFAERYRNLLPIVVSELQAMQAGTLWGEPSYRYFLVDEWDYRDPLVELLLAIKRMHGKQRCHG